MGAWALYNTTTGINNNAQGHSALYSNTIGIGNSAMGRNALKSNTTGSYNLGIGGNAGFSNSTGSGNVFIGRFAGYYETGSDKLYIANNLTTPLLYGEFSATDTSNRLGIGTNVIAVGDTITVANGAHLTTGGVWTNASSRELKDNIKPLSAADAESALNALSPVRYVYKNSGDEEYMGFIAEDVPDLVAMNDHKSLSPMDIVAVLTTVTKDQKAEITQQKAEITALKAELQIQRAQQDERILQMEMALAEVQRNQSSENRVGSRD
jgi:hypothetical protein